MKIEDFLVISFKVVPGFFCMVFCCVFIVFVHLSGQAVVPPTTGAEKDILSRNSRLDGQLRAFHYFCSTFSSILRENQ